MELPNDVLRGDGFAVWIAVDGSPCAHYGMEYEEADAGSGARRSAAGLHLRQIRCELTPPIEIDTSCSHPLVW